MKKIFLLYTYLLCYKTTVGQNTSIKCNGDVIQIAIPAIAFGSTFIWKDDNTKPTWQFVKSYGSGLILQQALKHIVLKPRPDGSDNFSFPSGHTTSAFSGAAFIQRRYGWKYSVPSYLLASFVGYSRIHAKKHDVYDVLGGASIGIGTAYLFTKPYEPTNINFNIHKANGVYSAVINYQF